jgi:hypothetical protein
VNYAQRGFDDVSLGAVVADHTGAFNDDVDVAPWVARIEARRSLVASDNPGVVRTLALMSQLLSLPRRVRKMWWRRRPPALQLPWIPAWSGLTARPFHNPADFPWVRALEESANDIREELHRVRERFGRAVYDSDRNIKTWKTFYFYLNGKPVEEHLAACPKTRAVLQGIPLNGLHVCFSAIEPGGFLQPHVGPTNVSLTAHLGLEGCRGTALWAAGRKRPYQDGKVLVFDDSFVHYVEHRGEKLRYTLMVTFWHPELNGLERALIARLLKMAPSDMFDHKPNPLDRPG